MSFGKISIFSQISSICSPLLILSLYCPGLSLLLTQNLKSKKKEKKPAPAILNFICTAQAMTRITINGQGSGTEDSSGPLTIDRTCPGVLSGFMSEHEWTSFCNKIDEALAPASLLKQKQDCYGCIFFLLAIAFIPLFFVEKYLNLSLFVVAVSLFVFLCVGLVVNSCVTMKLQEIKKKKVEPVCQEESRKISNVSFHYRVSERYFKEIV